MQKRRKIAVLGTRSVGKSSLVKQFVENSFSASYYPTIERAYVKNIVWRGQEYACEIYDTAGQDEFTPLNPLHVHGYIFVYSITNLASFELIQIVYDKLASLSGAGGDEIPCVIVGSKMDLAQGGRRKVSSASGAALAASNNAAFLEVSAKDGTNVVKAFELCIAEIEKRLNGPQEVVKDHRCLLM